MNNNLPPIEELEAGEAFRETMRPKADDQANLMWYGWVIMDAFLAGIQWERSRAGDAAEELGMHPDYKPFSDFIETDPAIRELIAFIGGWKPGETEICLDGNFTLDALRALVNYMTANG